MSELGAALRAIREKTGLSQRDFAEKVALDQSRISRIENGTLAPSPEDLNRWLSKCRAEDSTRVRRWNDTNWVALDAPRPPWDHPDLEALAEAAEALGRLQQAEVPDVLRASVRQYQEEIRGTAQSLRNLRYRAAFVGAPGVGKSTAEATGLELRTPAGNLVLPTGGGSTTVCEVHIEQGDRWGILVEPEPEEEIRRHVEDLCAATRNNKPERPPGERLVVPSEIRTALLNMAGLGPKTETGLDGQSIRREPLRELAEAEAEADRLLSSVLLRLRLAERTQTELWWEPGTTTEPLAWLQDNLRKINRGLHPTVSLPRRLRLILERPVVTGPYAVTVVDTRGVTDNNIRRPDLAECLADTRTVIVLSSYFLSAPDLYVTTLMQYANEQEFPSWRSRVAVLLLARPQEPEQVRYENTDELVETTEDGIRIKEAHTRQKLADLDASKVALSTFNSLQDPPERFRNVILERIQTIRAEDRERILALSVASADMLANARHHALQKARESVVSTVKLSLDQLGDLELGTAKPHESLLKEVGSAHAQVVWAMVRRQGRWRSLSLDLHLSDGSAQVARKVARDPILKLQGVLDMLKARPDIKEAQSLVQQVRDTVDLSRIAFVNEARSIALATLWSRMNADLQLWADCEGYWGRGAGFRAKVVERLDKWFASNNKHVEEFSDRLCAAWKKQFITPLSTLCSKSVSA